MPEERKERNDVYLKSITDGIERFHRSHNATSPNTKDTARLKIGVKQYLTATTIYRFETWQELWNTFQKVEPLIAAKVTNPKKPTDVPKVFRD